MNTEHTSSRFRVLALLVAAGIPFMSGCDNFLGITSTIFGTGFWWDIGTLPLRALVGTAVLNFVNTGNFGL